MSSPAMKVLLVEDEFMIAEFVAALLAANGMTAVGRVGTIPAALEAIEGTAFDCAVLDVTLNRLSIAPVADRLAALGKRYVFLTGGARHRLPPGHSHVPCVGKPVKVAELLAAIAGTADKRC
jgi:DNA-binding response OmpR family regulator